jgi:hypothetical protein
LPRFDPKPSVISAVGKRRQSGAPHFRPGYPERPCGDIPAIRIIPQEGPCFRVRVAPSFSQGILLEHLIFRSNPHHRDRVAPLSTTGGSRWACGIRQDGPGCGSRVSPQTRPKAFRADASSILHDPFRRTYPSGYPWMAEAIFRRAQVLSAEAVGTVPIHIVPCGTPPRSSFSSPRTAYEGR